MSETFAPPGASLFTASIGAPIVAVSPAAGQGLSLTALGMIDTAVSSTPSSSQIIPDAESLAGVTSYGNLATVGPQLTDLPDGIYFLLYGAIMEAVASGSPTPSPHRLSVQVNGTAASDTDSTWHRNGTETPTVMGALKTLANGGNNTITLKYRCIDASNGTWQQRFLIALRVGSLSS